MRTTSFFAMVIALAVSACTIRSDIRYLVVSKDVRRHVYINQLDYNAAITAEAAGSSRVVPAISFNNLSHPRRCASFIHLRNLPRKGRHH
jgi:hypothetical protein